MLILDKVELRAKKISKDSKESTCLVKTWIQPLGWEDPLEEDMGIRILAWRIPWTEEPGGLYSMGHTESGTA